jgi:hypothetical protein
MYIAFHIAGGEFVPLSTLGFVLAPKAPNKSLAALMPEAV